MKKILMLACWIALLTGCASTSQFDWGIPGLQAKQQEQARQQARELYVQTHPDLRQRIKDEILKGEIELGMSAEEVSASAGKPKEINRTVSTSGASEQWVYGDNFYVYFDNGILTSWQNTR